MLVPNDGLCRKVPRALYIVCGESAARMVARKNSVSNPGTGYSLIFLHSCEIKIWGWPGDEAMVTPVSGCITHQKDTPCHASIYTMIVNF